MRKHQKETTYPEPDHALTPPPYTLVEMLIPEKEGQSWAIEELTSGGPRHKQAYSALLLSRMHEQVKAITQKSDSRFSALEGQEISPRQTVN